jgi:hypothetical protein
MGNTEASERSEEWPFDEPLNVAVITTKSIIKDHYPILLATHDEEDGQWQFHDGGAPKIEDARIVSLYFMVSLDPSIAELANLTYGWRAWRETPTAPWRRQADYPERPSR